MWKREKSIGSIHEIIAKARQKKIVIVEVEKSKLSNLTCENHQGVVAIVPPFDYCEIEDIIDVAKEKVGGLIDDIKSGEIVDKADQAINKVTDFANKTVEDVKSGEFTRNVQEQFNKTVDSVKSGEMLNKAQEYVQNVKAGVEDLLDGKEEDKEVVEETTEELAEAVENAVEETKEEKTEL